MNKLTFKEREDGSIRIFSIDLIDHEGGDSPICIGTLDRDRKDQKYSLACNNGVTLFSSDEIIELAQKLKEINPS